MHTAILPEDPSGDKFPNQETGEQTKTNRRPAVAFPAKLRPGDKLASYEILASIGAGGMGEVYRARDMKLGRNVAIKVMRRAFANSAARIDRFNREARVLASLNHPNIAVIYGQEDRALVMELVEGPTLEEKIRDGPTPLGEALQIARQIADALEYAHERGVIHRDLKPANIKLTADGTVKVLDFGLAKLRGNPLSRSGDSVSPTLTMGPTKIGMLLGTVTYMAPEQARGKDVDKRADIWAFGVVLYELLTGTRLFGGETVSDTLAAVLTRDPCLDQVPAPARKLLRRCLDKDPKQRLRDIGEARFLMEEDSAEVPVTPRRRSWLRWAMAGITLAAFAVMCTLLWLRAAGGSFADGTVGPNTPNRVAQSWERGRP
jgi:serine/threonine protein kinase